MHMLAQNQSIDHYCQVQIELLNQDQDRIEHEKTLLAQRCNEFDMSDLSSDQVNSIHESLCDSLRGCDIITDLLFHVLTNPLVVSDCDALRDLRDEVRDDYLVTAGVVGVVGGVA